MPQASAISSSPANGIMTQAPARLNPVAIRAETINRAAQILTLPCQLRERFGVRSNRKPSGCGKRSTMESASIVNWPLNLMIVNYTVSATESDLATGRRDGLEHGACGSNLALQ